MEKTDSFTISIENHYWLGDEESDLCSHGEIHLAVNGQTITQSGIDEDWGISESALGLLRSLDGDGDGESEKIMHGCGTMLMLGCPISIHWTTVLQGNAVKLSGFYKVETTDPETGTCAYPELTALIPLIDYRIQVIRFAEETKAFFERSKPKIVEEEDVAMYAEFWQEFERLLEKHQ